MLTTITAQRVLRATAATLKWQAFDAEGNETNPGTVTVGVVRADGTTLVAAGTATGGAGVAPRTLALTASQTDELDYLTATWTVGGVDVGVTVHEIVGGFYVSAGDIRAADASLNNSQTYPTALLNEGRAEVERMFEDVCGVAFVPRFEVERLDGRNTSDLLLTWPQLRTVRWCRVWSNDTDYDTFTAAELAAIKPNRYGMIYRSDGNLFARGVQNVQVAYEHGYSAPPADMRKAAIRAIRHQVNRLKSPLDERATSFQMLEGGTVTLATPGVGRWVTGIPEVDETLMRYSHKTPSIA